MTRSTYRICTRCVMDTTDCEITFDVRGWCNHCTYYEQNTAPRIFGREEGVRELKEVVAQIRHDGKGSAYDCVIGLSGGVDSSLVALKVRELGLRPIAVHLDNSWDSEVAVRNIERIVRMLDLDLVTHVVNWQEFRDLQRAFFLASVIDVEMLTDHAILAFINRVAIDQGIRWIVSGTNHATESIMPLSWVHRKCDLRNVKCIHRRFGDLPMQTLPTTSMLRLQWYNRVRGIRTLSLLDYLGYRRAEAIDTLERELDWQNYGDKHFESLFTRFYQAHYLPTKFGVDKRRAHFSAQICSGQKTRAEALEELERPMYPPRDLAHDRDYVLKKLGFSETDWSAIMADRPRSHLDYGSDTSYILPLIRVGKLALTALQRRPGAGPSSGTTPRRRRRAPNSR